MRRTVAIVSIFLLGTGPAAPARTQKAAAAGSATFLVTGHGWGHGVGMSQYGAYGYAQKGFGYAKIVLHYFPGTELGDAPVSKVRVLLTSGVATLPVGYADGYRRSLTNKAEVLLRGRRVKQVGTVCMDMMMVDATDVADVQLGDEVVLLGGQGDERITAQDLADLCDTIPYELFCAIGARVPRVAV